MEDPDKELTLKNLTNELSTITSKCHAVGVQLHIKSSKIDEFEADFPNNMGKQFYKILDYWLKRNTDTPVTWESIVNALNSSSVDEKGLAAQIQTRYCLSTCGAGNQESKEDTAGMSFSMEDAGEKTEDVFVQPTTGTLATPVSKGRNVQRKLDLSDSNQGMFRQREDSGIGLETPFNTPSDKNKPLCTSTPNQLQGQPTGAFDLVRRPLKEINSQQETPQLVIRSDSGFCSQSSTSPTTEEENYPKWSNNPTKTSRLESELQIDLRSLVREYNQTFLKIKSSFSNNSSISVSDVIMQLNNLRLGGKRHGFTSMDEIFVFLSGLGSWFNTRILEDLVENSGSSGDQQLMKKYCEKREKYLKRSVYDIPKAGYGSIDSENESTRRNDVRLVLKLPGDRKDFTGNDLQQLITKVFEILKIHVELLSVQEGCLELIFKILLVPDYLSPTQEDSLKRCGFVRLTINDKIYFSVREEASHCDTDENDKSYFLKPPTVLCGRKRNASDSDTSTSCSPPSKMHCGE